MRPAKQNAKFYIIMKMFRSDCLWGHTVRTVSISIHLRHQYFFISTHIDLPIKQTELLLIKYITRSSNRFLHILLLTCKKEN